MSKLTVNSLSKNDYVLFELLRVTAPQTLKCACIKQYFRVLDAPFKGAHAWVGLYDGVKYLILSDNNMSEDNLLSTSVTYVTLGYSTENKIKISFPPFKELPWRLRIVRAFLNLFSEAK